MDDLFDSAWLKWAWGVRNAQVLLDSIKTFALQPNLQMYLPTSQHYHPKRHCIVLVVDDVVDPFPKLWGLLLGDVVHNWRGALDHVAWALYKRGKTPNEPKWKESGVYFPITTKRLKFNESLVGRRPKLPGVKLRDSAVVRRYQPYLGGKRKAPTHFFYILDELAKADKHRTLQPVLAFPETVTWTILGTRDCIYRDAFPKSYETRGRLNQAQNSSASTSRRLVPNRTLRCSHTSPSSQRFMSGFLSRNGCEGPGR
jgi:hypothetical protein